jgi:hypothetical protein
MLLHNCLTRQIAFFSAALSIVLASVAHGDDDRGRGKGGGGHRHGGGSFQFLDVSPYGVSYGYQDRNFGMTLGPFGGGAFGGNYYPPAADPGIVAGPPVVYSEPIVDSYGGYAQPSSPPIAQGNPSVESPSPGSGNYHPAAEPFLRQSVDSFRNGDYETASRLADHAIIEDSQSGFLRLHASQCLVATQTFDAAASALFDGLDRMDSSEWGREIKNFRNLYKQNDYVTHMKQLERFAAEHPEVPYANALCAYHFHFLGHQEAARRHLTSAKKANPNDALVQLLAKVIRLESPEELPNPTSILVPSK